MRASLTAIKEALDGFDLTSNPWTFLTTVLLDRTRIAAAISTSGETTARARGLAIWQFMNFVRAQPRAAGLPISRMLDRIRRLVLLADERDLRELPAAAQGIDAVRMMTVHGSKGLEFQAVHIPGMSVDTLPRSPNHVRGCTPPDGMVEGATGTGIEVLKAGHVEEQECLFFVALSRARDRLVLYSPTKKSNGAPRKQSPFIDRLGATIERRTAAPKIALPPASDETPIPIAFPEGILLSDHKLALFQRCPRRFFYTHVLEVGGRRSETAFMQMHGAVRSVVDWLTGDPATTPSPTEVDARLAEAWDEQKLAGHGYSDDFKRVARQLLAAFIASRDGFERSVPEVMRLAVSGGEVLVRPDEALTQGGHLHLRSVRTGHKSSDEMETVATAVFALAAEGAFPGCTVEFVHLSDNEVTPVDMSNRVLENRRKTAGEMLAKIGAGAFPRKESPRSCPRCPAFFICGPVPDGPVEKKFVF